MNIAKRDISAYKNHAGHWVLTTIHNGYFRQYVTDTASLKLAKVEFIELLKAGEIA